MAKVTIPSLVVRTTSDNPGYAHCVAIGAGLTAADALEELENEAHRQAVDLASGFTDDERDEAEWLFHVIDVKLTAAPPSTDPAWVAMGTLASYGKTPWSGSYWDQPR